MRKTVVALSLTFLMAAALYAEVEVPVTYDLGVKGGERMVGFITGGSICEAEGIQVSTPNASSPVLYKYVDIDKISGMAIQGSGTLGFDLYLRDGKKLAGSVKVTETEPMIILRDEVASGDTTVLGKERSFSQANFRGIPLIEFEAAVASEASLEDVKAMTKTLQEALDAGNMDKAIEAHNQIGEMLESLVGEDGAASPTADLKGK